MPVSPASNQLTTSPLDPIDGLGTREFVRFSNSQKAFVLHYGCYCSPLEMVARFEPHFGTDRPVDDTKLKMLGRYLINTGQEMTLLNDATTYEWYTAVPVNTDGENMQHIGGLGDCSGEQQAFLGHHALKVTHARIVEMFNEQFLTAIDIDILEGLLSALRVKGNEPHLLVAATDFDWHKKYLPKLPPPLKAKVPAPPPRKKEPKEKPPKTLKTPKPLKPPESKASRVRKAKQGFSLEQRSCLAWMSEGVLHHDKICEDFKGLFGDLCEDRKLKNELNWIKYNQDRLDTLADGVESYE